MMDVFKRSLLLIVTLRLVSFGISSLRPQIHSMSFASELSGFVVSFAFVSLLLLLQQITSKTAVRVFCVVLTSALIVFMPVSNYFVYREFGEFLSPNMVRFVKSDLHYLWGYAVTYVSFPVASLIVVATIGLSYLLFIPQRNTRKLHLYLALGACVVFFVAGLNSIRRNAIFNHGSLDARTLFALWLGSGKGSEDTRLHRSHRIEVSVQSKQKLPNIILVINESWGKKHFNGGVLNAEAAPNLANLMTNPDHAVISFSRAYTNSPATDVSIPSILTGVSPDAPSSVLHEVPLLWSWAKAAGYRTIFATSQSWTWAGFDDFFTPKPDVFYALNDLTGGVVNDLGGDDVEAIEALTSKLPIPTADQPTLLIYFSNALHAPFQTQSKRFSPNGTPLSRYDAAHQIIDYAMERLFRFYREHGALNNTVMILTSDHGEADNVFFTQVPRTVSFYDEIAQIPFLIIVPRGWADEHAAYIEALRSNQHRIISNLDILPTLVDLWGVRAGNEEALSKLNGHSLLTAIPSERLVLSQSTSDNRRWNPEGFGIYGENFKIIFSTIEGLKYFEKNGPDIKMIPLNSSEKSNVEALIKNFRHPARMMSGNR